MSMVTGHLLSRAGQGRPPAHVHPAPIRGRMGQYAHTFPAGTLRTGYVTMPVRPAHQRTDPPVGPPRPGRRTNSADRSRNPKGHRSNPPLHRTAPPHKGQIDPAGACVSR